MNKEKEWYDNFKKLHVFLIVLFILQQQLHGFVLVLILSDEYNFWRKEITN